MEKVAYTLVEIHTSISAKKTKLFAAKNSIADLELELRTVEQSMEESKSKEKSLPENWNNEKASLTAVEKSINEPRDIVELWTTGLIDIAGHLNS